MTPFEKIIVFWVFADLIFLLLLYLNNRENSKLSKSIYKLHSTNWDNRVKQRTLDKIDAQVDKIINKNEDLIQLQLENAKQYLRDQLKEN